MIKNSVLLLVVFFSLISEAFAVHVRFFAVFSDDSQETAQSLATTTEILTTIQKNFALTYDSDDGSKTNKVSPKSWKIAEITSFTIFSRDRNLSSNQNYRQISCYFEGMERTFQWYHSATTTWNNNNYSLWTAEDSPYKKSSPFHDFDYFTSEDYQQPAVIFFMKSGNHQHALFTDREKFYRSPKKILRQDFSGELPVERVFVINLSEHIQNLAN